MPLRPSWIVLARILRPQGRRGEVLADLFTGSTAQFEEHPQVWLAPRGFAEAEPGAAAAEPAPVTIRDLRLGMGRNAGRVVLHFAGVDSIEQAEALAGREVVIPVAVRRQPEPDEVYISDLIGATVFDRECAIGVVREVRFPMTPDGLRRLEDAAALLAVESPEKDELLIPFARAFVREINLADGRIRMELPAGLLDLNRRVAAKDSESPEASRHRRSSPSRDAKR